MGHRLLVAFDSVGRHETAEVGEANLVEAVEVGFLVVDIGEAVLLDEVAEEVDGHVDVGVGAQVVVLLHVFHAMVHHGVQGFGMETEETVVDFRVVAFGFVEQTASGSRRSFPWGRPV